MLTSPKNSPTTAPTVDTPGLDATSAGLLRELSGGLDPTRPGDPSGLVARASRPDFGRWLTHAAKARGCTRPVRLRGEVLTVQASTGVVVDRFSTDDLPDRVLYKPCGTRLASVCPSCAEVYRWDTYQLIKAGLAGGKGVPDTVATHPAVFVTLTAPSFGPVHTRTTTRDGRPRPCHARRNAETCPHGRRMSCPFAHTGDDPRLGQPLCGDCYDHTGHVVWNRYAGKLWDRTIRTIRRQLGADTGGHLKLRYAKVAEYQRRGIVHLHALLRLDGAVPGDPDAIVPPPHGVGPDGQPVPLYTAQLLHDAIRAAAADTAITTPAHPEQPSGWRIAWGAQVDVKTVRTGLPGDDLTDRHVAGYLAKYATKATEITGHSAGRVDPDAADYYAASTRHSHRLIAACWHLGEAPGWEGLRRWAHMLGFGGHFSTKSRTYSTTLTALRNARRGHHTNSGGQEHGGEETTLVLAHWQHVGNGWRTPADAALAAQAADAARQRRPAVAHHPTEGVPPS